MPAKVKPDARPASNLTEVPQQAGIINFVHVTNFFELVASIHNLRIKGLKWQRDQVESIQVSFPLSNKINSRTAPVHPRYQWLTQADQNGMAVTEEELDFQQYAINPEGYWHSVFSAEASPMNA
jgi:hypothetical protein